MSTSAIIDNGGVRSGTGTTMRASVLCDVGQIEVRDVPRPHISSYEVLVRVSAVGLCGTDAHIFAGHSNYNTNERGVPIPLAVQPQILGHEIAGIVEQVGSQVGGLQVGDRVVVDQGLNCVSTRRALCEYCRTGDSHQCEFYREHGVTLLGEPLTIGAIGGFALILVGLLVLWLWMASMALAIGSGAAADSGTLQEQHRRWRSHGTAEGCT